MRPKPALPRPFAVAALLLAALALVAVGCGDSDDAPENPGSAATGKDGAVSTTVEPGDADATIPELPVNDDPSAVQCTGPPEGVVDATGLVGESLDAATETVEAQGCGIRVVIKDGKPLAATQDFRPDRINVEVTDGEIEKIIDIG